MQSHIKIWPGLILCSRSAWHEVDAQVSRTTRIRATGHVQMNWISSRGNKSPIKPVLDPGRFLGRGFPPGVFELLRARISRMNKSMLTWIGISMAPLVRLERTTVGLEVRRSIH
jgi:hypothetical protein